MIIYKITNRINGKVYIGQTTKSIQHRWRKHCEPTSGCTALRSAIQKYGKENFTVEQIDVATDREELDRKEEHWIAHYNSMSPNGYNLTSGGDSPVEISEETRIKRSIANTGKKMSPESRAKMSVAKKGRKLSEEEKEKLRRGLETRWSNPENRRKQSEVSKARMTPEMREMVRKRHTGRKCSAETREKMRLAQLGKKHSEETKAKLREMNLGKKLSPEVVERMTKAHQKAVMCVETGEIFDSLKMAGQKCKLDSHHISCVCRGKRKTAGGYHWRYADAK